MHFAFVFAALLLLSACGFTPLYGTDHGAVRTDLAAVAIDNIPDREGQMLRNKLMDLFYRQGRPAAPVYVLDIAPLRQTETDLDITKSSEATRGQLRFETTMKLRRTDTGETVLRRDLSAVTSYNILHSHFTTRVSQTDARENAVNDLARQIETQLSLYFRRL